MALLTLVVAGCGAGASSTASSGSSSSPSSEGGSTVWLCRPGAANDPCTAPLAATVVPAAGARTTQRAPDDAASKFDCFYVYPTVSSEKSANANLKVQPAEVAAAVAQASRFSQVCRVWAPMYRQRTAASLASGLGANPNADAVAYESLLSAWKDYLAHDNDGRPIIFIGHSQGSAMLIRLLSSQVDPNVKLRARTVTAILAGGNVTVPVGKTVGSTFHHLPLCTATTQTGCVIAYSSFPSQPPANSNFGRPGQGVSLQSNQTATAGLQVACVNPAAIGGGVADLKSYFLTASSTPAPPPVSTPWINYPDLYSGACAQGGGATWLQITPLNVAGRPVVSEALGPTWGYHLDDINLALGNLVNDVKAQEEAYGHR
ncbi:MAG TPA: DUF3089 domain-containing protein [Acidimicrobiales bacterium]